MRRQALPKKDAGVPPSLLGPCVRKQDSNPITRQTKSLYSKRTHTRTHATTTHVKHLQKAGLSSLLSVRGTRDYYEDDANRRIYTRERRREERRI